MTILARSLLVLSVLSGAMGSMTASQAEDGGLRKLHVDATRPVGQLRDFQGVSGAPATGFDSPEGRWHSTTAVDISDEYRAARVDLIRTHDAFGAGDIDARFGHAGPGMVQVPADRTALNLFPDMNADPEDPRSYNFAPTDRLIASIVAVGAQPLFRIGRSIGATAEPPLDPDKYAAIARHLVMHYNQGWANGFRYGIRHWEIWNEPDFQFFWSGTPEQYYALYAKSVRAIKAVDPTALVGGPTIARPLDAGAYRESFLEYVRREGLPLDFFAWHFYAMDSNDPFVFTRIARELRTVLDSHGFAKTRSVLDEWNADLFDREMTDAARASFVASSLIYMLDAPIDLQAFYRADMAFRRRPGPSPVGHALTAFGRMKDTPVLLADQGGDDAGLAVLAGRSEDGGTVQVLISNYQIPQRYLGPRTQGNVLRIPNVMDITLPERRSLTYSDNAGYELIVDLPREGAYTVERYKISESDSLRRVARTIEQGKRVEVRAALPPPGIELIVLKRNP